MVYKGSIVGIYTQAFLDSVTGTDFVAIHRHVITSVLTDYAIGMYGGLHLEIP
jgi:hypothetical protein